MPFAADPWDLLLIAAVSLQVTAVAYLRAPRWKALILCLPFPFTIVALGLGRPIDVTNLLGLIAIFLYVHAIRLLYRRLGLPIIPAISLALAGYCLLGWAVVDLLPATPMSFWTTAVAVCLLAFFLHRRLPPRSEPGHRTPLPVWLKLPVVVAVVCLLLLVKESLQGFATLFPLVSVVGAYEARHSLWTLGRQMPVLMLTLTPLMAVAHLTQKHVGLGPSLLFGWAAFLLILLPLTRAMWRRKAA
ncbi:MAG: hypothetical protein HOC74_16740 [Gemmatimonadetes bacterium]|jgi:hypothetical protein|nr:hypothetical protein [Gemmatimonadota bacterium]